jgi:hypothetical protein
MTVAWTDVTGWTTLWAPDDGPAITAAVLAQIEDGQAKGATLFSSQYSITDAPILEAMGVIGAANPACRFLFDSSEYAGKYEKPLVDALIAKLQPDQWAIGTAPDGHDILHNKVCALLYPDNTGWSFFGSFNLSGSAEKESNNAHFLWSRQFAEALAAQVQTGLTWCATHQPQPPTAPAQADSVEETGHEHEQPSTEREPL